MKKINTIVAIVAVALALFLIWLWYFLGFDQIDAPLDLVMGIVWIVCVVIFALVLNRQESTRRELVRRVFFANGVLYNSEAGPHPCSPDALVETVEQILAGLQYSMPVQDMPEAFEYEYIVRTGDFVQETVTDEQTGQQGKVVSRWSGFLFNREMGTETPFGSKEELSSLVETQLV